VATAGPASRLEASKGAIFAKVFFRAERGRAGPKSALLKPSQGPGA